MGYSRKTETGGEGGGGLNFQGYLENSKQNFQGLIKNDMEYFQGVVKKTCWIYFHGFWYGLARP